MQFYFQSTTNLFCNNNFIICRIHVNFYIWHSQYDIVNFRPIKPSTKCGHMPQAASSMSIREKTFGGF
jgi:hypothetical protein